MNDLHENDNVARAIAWILFGVLAGLCLDLCAKQLLQTYSLVQFVLLRSGIAIVLMLAMLPRFGGWKALHSEEKLWHLVRSLFAIGAMFGFFYGLKTMPLVAALTLGYTAPLIVTALSALVLGDSVGWRRWSAVTIGFVGVLVMLRPGSGEFTPAAAAVLVAAFCYACQAITARKLGGTESTLALSFYVIVGPFALAVAIFDFGTWIEPDTGGWVLLAGAAVCSICAWFGFVNGYRAAPPALLAPLEYVALVLGAVAGYLIWDEIPDRFTVLGALIIVGSGLFVVYRGKPAPVVT